MEKENEALKKIGNVSFQKLAWKMRFFAIFPHFTKIPT